MCRYERNGPYDILIDGANVAFFGQNRDGGGFRWAQIIAMTRLVQRENPGKKVLLVRGGEGERGRGEASAGTRSSP